MFEQDQGQFGNEWFSAAVPVVSRFGERSSEGEPDESHQAPQLREVSIFWCSDHNVSPVAKKTGS